MNTGHPSQNPPLLDAHSEAVIGWFGSHVNAFVMEFGVMPELIRRTGLEGDGLALFLRKADMVFGMQKRVAEMKETRDG